MEALEQGWNSRANIAESRNNDRVHEMHRAYFDKVPGQRYVSINYDLYGASAHAPPSARRTRKRRPRGHGHTAGAAGSGAGIGVGSDDPSEFIVVVHVVSTAGERLPGSRVAVHLKHTGDVVGTGVSDSSGRAVVVCHYDAWPAVPFFLEAASPGFVPAGLDFEVTARECAAQVALESEEEVAHRAALESLHAEEARRVARQRFTVRCEVVHLATRDPVPGATVIVRTAHHGSMCGQAVTDAQGVALVPCLHPHWQTAPLRAETAIKGFVPASADLFVVAGSSVMDTRLLVETEAEVAARHAEDAAKFTVITVVRDADSTLPVDHARVTLRDPQSLEVLAEGDSMLDGSVRLEAEHKEWATAPITLEVAHPDYPSYQEVVHMGSREQRFVVRLTSLEALRRRREAAAAAVVAREAALQQEQEQERKAAVELTKHVVDHARLTDDEFCVTTYVVSLLTGVSLPGAAVSLVVKATGQAVGDAVTDERGKAEVVGCFPGWRRREFLLMCELDGYKASAKALSVTKTAQLVRVALERGEGRGNGAGGGEGSGAAAADDRREFQIVVHVRDSGTGAPLGSAKVLLKVRATGDVLASGSSNGEGACLLRATLSNWYEEAMYLHVAAAGFSAAASDVNITSRSVVTEVRLDSEAAAAAKRLNRAQTSNSMRAQLARFKVGVKVVDASSKAPVPGAEVRIAVAATAKTVATAFTDATGVAQFDTHHRRWNKTAFVLEARKAGWVSVPQRMRIPHTDYSAQLVLAQPTKPGELRVVLTWVEDPQDLDLHLLCPSGTDVSFKYQADADMGAVLEVDDRSGYGPETVLLQLGKADAWYVGGCCALVLVLVLVLVPFDLALELTPPGACVCHDCPYAGIGSPFTTSPRTSPSCAARHRSP